MSNEHGEVRKFFFAALAELRIQADVDGPDRYLLTIPQEFQEELDGREKVLVTFDKEVFQNSDESDLEFITPGSPILLRLVERVRKLGCVFHASLCYDDGKQEETAAKIARAYNLQDGEVSVLPFQSPDGLYIRFHYLVRLKAIENRERLVHICVDDHGRIVGDEEMHNLGRMPSSEPTEKRSIPNERLRTMLERARVEIDRIRGIDEDGLRRTFEGRRIAEENQIREYFTKVKEEIKGAVETLQSRNGVEDLEEQIASIDQQMKQRLEEMGDRFSVSGESHLVGALLIWYKRFVGEVTFTDGRSKVVQRIDMPLHADKIPAVQCSKTGSYTYRLVLTADGRLVDSSIAATCARSGKVMPRDEMGVCSMTGRILCREHLITTADGRLVDSSITATCAKSGKIMPRDEMGVCSVTGKLLCHEYLATTSDGRLVDSSLSASCTRSGKIMLRNEMGVCEVTARLLCREFLVALSDGRLVDSSITATCAESGRLMLRDQLRICSVTGRLFCPEYVTDCPINGTTVQKKILVECPECLQRVGPQAMEGRICKACMHPIRVEKDDPRVRYFIDKYPRLRGWAKWALAETHDVYVVELHGILRAAKIVLRKSDLRSIKCMKKLRAFGSWSETTMNDLEGST